MKYLPFDLKFKIFQFLPFEEYMSKQLISRDFNQLFTLERKSFMLSRMLNQNKSMTYPELKSIYNKCFVKPESCDVHTFTTNAIIDGNVAGLVNYLTIHLTTPTLLRRIIIAMDDASLYHHFMDICSEKSFEKLISALKKLPKNIFSCLSDLCKIVCLTKESYLKFHKYICDIVDTEQFCRYIYKYDIDEIKLVDPKLDYLLRYMSLNFTNKCWDKFELFYKLDPTLLQYNLKAVLFHKESLDKDHYEILKKYFTLEYIFKSSISTSTTNNFTFILECINEGYIPNHEDILSVVKERSFDHLDFIELILSKGIIEHNDYFNLLLSTDTDYIKRHYYFESDYKYLSPNNKLIYCCLTSDSYSYDENIPIHTEDVSEVNGKHLAYLLDVMARNIYYRKHDNNSYDPTEVIQVIKCLNNKIKEIDSFYDKLVDIYFDPNYNIEEIKALKVFIQNQLIDPVILFDHMKERLEKVDSFEEKEKGLFEEDELYNDDQIEEKKYWISECNKFFQKYLGKDLATQDEQDDVEKQDYEEDLECHGEDDQDEEEENHDSAQSFDLELEEDL